MGTTESSSSSQLIMTSPAQPLSGPNTISSGEGCCKDTDVALALKDPPQSEHQQRPAELEDTSVPLSAISSTSRTPATHNDSNKPGSVLKLRPSGLRRIAQSNSTPLEASPRESADDEAELNNAQDPLSDQSQAPNWENLADLRVRGGAREPTRRLESPTRDSGEVIIATAMPVASHEVAREKSPHPDLLWQLDNFHDASIYELARFIRSSAPSPEDQTRQGLFNEEPISAFSPESLEASTHALTAFDTERRSRQGSSRNPAGRNPRLDRGQRGEVATSTGGFRSRTQSSNSRSPPWKRRRTVEDDPQAAIAGRNVAAQRDIEFWPAQRNLPYPLEGGLDVMPRVPQAIFDSRSSNVRFSPIEWGQGAQAASSFGRRPPGIRHDLERHFDVPGSQHVAQAAQLGVPSGRQSRTPNHPEPASDPHSPRMIKPLHIPDVRRLNTQQSGAQASQRMQQRAPGSSGPHIPKQSSRRAGATRSVTSGHQENVRNPSANQNLGEDEPRTASKHDSQVVDKIKNLYITDLPPEYVNNVPEGAILNGPYGAYRVTRIDGLLQAMKRTIDLLEDDILESF